MFSAGVGNAVDSGAVTPKGLSPVLAMVPMGVQMRMRMLVENRDNVCLSC